MFHWEEGSEYRCGVEWCVEKCCCHRDVDDDDELDIKKVQLRALLGLDGGESWRVCSMWKKKLGKNPARQ